MSGAGLGGCVMVLVANAHREQVVGALRSRALEADLYAPVEGAGLLVI